MNERKADHPIHPMILHRFSSRAMTGEEISDGELASLFEAARWAPSSYNNQPWRIIYAKKSEPEFGTFFDLLVPFNQSWANKAAVLGCFLSHTIFDHNQKPSITHAFDTGAAWENFALEGCHRGLVVHGMQGFDYEGARRKLLVPGDYEIHAMFAVGKKASLDSLSLELQAKELPSSRKKIEEFVMQGTFHKK